MSAAPVELEPVDAIRVIVRRMDISHAADLWLGEHERKNDSDRTIDTYRRVLAKLSDEYPHADIAEVTATQLRRFLDLNSRRKDGKRKSAASLAQAVTVINGFFDWVTFEGLIERNPTRRNGQRILSRPKQVAPDENDNVLTISGDDVVLLMHAADNRTNHPHYWSRRLAVYTAALLGPRRHALSNVRIGDYDPVERTIRFHEKGAKVIEKPVPHELADVIDAAIQAGVYERQRDERGEDYLIPGRAKQRRPGDRDDRVIWHLVRDVAEDAQVKTHVHALRAAFAVAYLEMYPGRSRALQNLMGHKRPETTDVYLRRLNRREEMETVRGLSYGQGEIRTREPVFADHPLSRRAPSATRAPVHVGNKDFASKPLESKPDPVTLGLEPSIDAHPVPMRAGIEHGASAPGKEPLLDAVQGP